MRGGDLDEDSITSLGQTCIRTNLLAPEVPLTPATVAGVLSDVGQRLRYAIGEYTSDPTVSPDGSGWVGQT